MRTQWAVGDAAMEGRAPPPGKSQPRAGKNSAGGVRGVTFSYLISLPWGHQGASQLVQPQEASKADWLVPVAWKGTKRLCQLHSQDHRALLCAEYIRRLSWRTTRAVFPLTGGVGGWDVIASLAPDPALGPTEPLSVLAVTEAHTRPRTP